MTNVQFCLLISEALVPIYGNSRIVKTYLASVMTLNNLQTITETRSYIDVVDVVLE